LLKNKQDIEQENKIRFLNGGGVLTRFNKN